MRGQYVPSLVPLLAYISGTVLSYVNNGTGLAVLYLTPLNKVLNSRLFSLSGASHSAKFLNLILSPFHMEGVVGGVDGGGRAGSALKM